MSVGLLELDSKVSSGYLQEVLTAAKNLGPYFVIAPHIAIAHAAPSSNVLETGFALLKLETPVASGSINDPVRLLFAFCAKDADSHLELLSEFAQVMSSPGKVNTLLNESNAEAIRRHLLDSVG
jgi:PTS system ascorbate-specific IIA component